MQIDWNAVIHILDELSDGTHSFLELSYMPPNYGRVAFVAALVFLAERELIELSKGRGPFEPIPKSDWPTLLRKCFGTEHVEQKKLVSHSIDLSQRGEQLLHILGVGHP
ncbi:MAG: hypothetical protein J7493_17120 [Porphyrobacter sp.]|nr:hypothetical protein [Porphyrobacter sp.]